MNSKVSSDMGNEERTVNLPKFNGKDFAVWKTQVEAYLISRGKLDPIARSRPRRILKTRDGVTDAEVLQRDSEIEAYDNMDRWVRSTILLSLDNEFVKNVMCCTTSKEIWERLSSLHEETSAANRVLLLAEFYEIKLKPDETIKSYVARAEYLYSQMKDCGVKSIDEATLVSKIVSGLPRWFMNFMSNWAERDHEKQRMVDLLPRLLQEEKLINRFRKPKVENAHNTETKQNNAQKNKNGGNKNNSKNSGKQNNNKKEKKTDEQKAYWQNRCYQCGKEGHIKPQCPDRKAKAPEKQEGNTSESVIVVEEANSSIDSSNWIVDTGATRHMSYDKRDFINYQPFDEATTVLFGDKGTAQGLGIGDVKLIASVGEKEKLLTIKGVMYVPALRRKLISISKATANGCIGEIQPDRLVLRDKSNAVALVALRQNGLYLAQVRQEAETFIVEDKTDLWHQRFGHINCRTLVKTCKAVEGMPTVSDRLETNQVGDSIGCLACKMGKQSLKTFKSRSSPRATSIGEAVHMDICGPVGQATFSGAQYFILFKDEFSNFRWIYFMKSREEAFGNICKLVAKVFAETQNNIRKLVSDCGSEFTSKRTQDFLIQNKIIHQTSAPFSPSQNGFIERDNRTIMEGVRSMLSGKKLPQNLWGEAAATFVYLLNISVNSNTLAETPWQLYYQKKPRVSHLRVFGCLAMVKPPAKKRSGYQKKLEERSQLGILVGYEQPFTYRVLVDDKIVVTREVVFDESKTLGDNSDFGTLDDIVLELAGDDDQEELDTVQVVEGTQEVFTASLDEPSSYREAVRRPDADRWRSAMDEEFEALTKLGTWTLVPLPKGRRTIDCKWVYKVKYDKNGNVERYKARLVARGFTQRYGLDYKETFSPVVMMSSIRILITLVNQFDLEVMQIDVKTAFLHGSLDEEIFMAQPEGYKRGENLVCKLEKSLYGLKQASKQWNTCFAAFLLEFNLQGNIPHVYTQNGLPPT